MTVNNNNNNIGNANLYVLNTNGGSGTTPSHQRSLDGTPYPTTMAPSFNRPTLNLQAATAAEKEILSEQIAAQLTTSLTAAIESYATQQLTNPGAVESSYSTGDPNAAQQDFGTQPQSPFAPSSQSAVNQPSTRQLRMAQAQIQAAVQTLVDSGATPTSSTLTPAQRQNINQYKKDVFAKQKFLEAHPEYMTNDELLPSD